MKSIGVFCGADTSIKEEYKKSAKLLGRLLGQRNIRLVYGGASVGLMGVLADSVLEHGGKILGVMPSHLNEKEITHYGLTELKLVDSIRERKRIIVDESDAFIVLPGGLGTLEELFEVWSSIKMGLYNKPMGILNINNYYGWLLAFTENAVEEGFLKQAHKNLLHVHQDVTELLDDMIEGMHNKPTASATISLSKGSRVHF